MQSNKPNKSIIFGITVIAIAILVSILLTKMRGKPEPSQPPQPSLAEVVVNQVQLSTNTPSVTASARATAKYDINIVAQVSGLIESVEPGFSRGTYVLENDDLLKIDDLDYLAARSQAQSNVAQAEQNLASEKAQSRQAEREWRDLGSQEANDLFLRIPQIKSAEANLDAAKAALLQAEQNLRRTAVIAPFSGQIGNLNANLGEFVSIGSPIARLVSIHHLEIAVPMTLKQLSLLGIENNLNSSTNFQTEVKIFFGENRISSSKNTMVTHGQLNRIDRILNEDSQVIYAIVEVIDENTPLKVGQLVHISIPGNPRQNSVWLPEKALYKRSQVLTVENGKLQSVEIELLDFNNDQILISGIEDGAQVVIDRPLWSTVGSEVIIKDSEESQD